MISRFANPIGLAVDIYGNVWIADNGSSRIRKINSTGYVSTVSGTPYMLGFSNASQPANSSLLWHPSGLFYDNAADQLLIADTINQAIRVLTFK